jgi:GT2 family glycosyltransferase
VVEGQRPSVAVVIPTLGGEAVLTECLEGLRRQTFTDFETIVVDNSGAGKVKGLASTDPPLRVIANPRNVGFGAAINQGWRASASEFVATLNDDAVPHPEWLEELVAGMDFCTNVGMCASRVLLKGTGLVDSAGMLIASDASSKQRGHGEPAADYDEPSESLLPSGSAALYRRAMLDEIGGFDEEFFLYCEDTDLGLRGRWAGWQCRYLPGAVVEHRYSHSSGRASALKAYYVERNRLFTAVRNLPPRALIVVPFASALRYAWHVWFLLQGRGTAAEFSAQQNPFRLAWFVVRAWGASVWRLPELLRERRKIQAKARLNDSDFRRLLRRHSIPLRQVAAL